MDVAQRHHETCPTLDRALRPLSSTLHASSGERPNSRWSSPKEDPMASEGFVGRLDNGAEGAEGQNTTMSDSHGPCAGCDPSRAAGFEAVGDQRY